MTRRVQPGQARDEPARRRREAGDEEHGRREAEGDVRRHDEHTLERAGDLAYAELARGDQDPERGHPRSQLDERRQPLHRHVEADLLSNNPDIMFVAKQTGTGTLFDKWSADQLFPNLKAVEGKQVYQVNTNLWSKARGILAGEKIAQQAVHLLYHKYVSIALPDVTSTT
jgi:hypothetical protein